MNQMQLPLEMHEKASTASHSSKQINKNHSTTDKVGLVRNVQGLLKKNEIKYDTILKNNPEFSIKLYKPCSGVIRNKISALNEELLLKQLDNLMEDQYILDKELNKINFQLQEHEKQKEQQTYNHMNHYQFLRSVWNSYPLDSSSQDRLHNLNQKVTFIKGHIRNLIAKEQYTPQPQGIQSIIQSSQEYQKLKEKIQRYEMEQEDTLKNIDLAERKQDKLIIQELRKENQTLRIKNQEEKDKSRKLQHQIIQLNMKIQEVDKALIDKSKELTKFHRERKYIYEKKDQFSLILTSNSIFQHRTITINKTLDEVHQFLTEERAHNEYGLKFAQRLNDLDSDGTKGRKLFRNEKENPRKVRHIKGMNDLRSVDEKKPKFLRSSTLIEDGSNIREDRREGDKN